MENENYIVIQGFMRNELNLKGNELMVYALIYGFSQDGESAFTGSVGYIAEWIGATKQTVHNVLKSLCEKQLLNKQEEYKNGIKFCTYTAVLLVVKKFDRGVVKNFDGGSKKIIPNNIEYNAKEDIYRNVPEELKPAFMEWAKMRKGIKKPIPSKQSVERALNKLDQIAKTTEQKIRLIELATDKCWLSFYPEKGAAKGTTYSPEPPRYKELKPDEEIETSQMPEHMREKYNAFQKGLDL